MFRLVIFVYVLNAKQSCYKYFGGNEVINRHLCKNGSPKQQRGLKSRDIPLATLWIWIPTSKIESENFPDFSPTTQDRDKQQKQQSAYKIARRLV